MNAGAEYQYLWQDARNYKTPTKVKIHCDRHINQTQPNQTQTLGVGQGVRGPAARLGGGAAQRRGHLPGVHRCALSPFSLSLLWGHPCHCPLPVSFSHIHIHTYTRPRNSPTPTPPKSNTQQRTGVPFPRHFRTTVQKIFTRIFRIYAHLYLTHLPHIESAGALTHLNSCFKCVALWS